MSTFPVDHTNLKLIRPIVRLAQRIDKETHAITKAKWDEDWLSNMAKEAELHSSEDSDQWVFKLQALI